MAADERLELDARLIPTVTADVETVNGDFRSGSLIGAREIDHAFTALGRDGNGRTAIDVTGPGGGGVRLSFGRSAIWVQIHTADRPEPEWSRRGLAVEPMSCLPHAFNSGTDLVVLRPHERHEAGWRTGMVNSAVPHRAR